MRLFLWSHQPFIEIKIWSGDDGSLPRHGASSGDHFLNPLARLFIEIPMIGVLFRIQEHKMWGRFQFVANKISRLRENPF